MPRIAGGDRGPPRQGDPGNLRIAHVHRLAGLLPLCREGSRLCGGCAVEGQHTAFQIVFHQPGKYALKCFPAPAQQRQTIAAFKFGKLVTQIDSGAWLSSQAITSLSGSLRIKAESNWYRE